MGWVESARSDRQPGHVAKRSVDRAIDKLQAFPIFYNTTSS
jgi:hypothetical protein